MLWVTVETPFTTPIAGLVPRWTPGCRGIPRQLSRFRTFNHYERLNPERASLVSRLGIQDATYTPDAVPHRATQRATQNECNTDTIDELAQCCHHTLDHAPYH